MNKKIGQLIKERVESSQFDVTEFAKKINKERSNVYDIFKRDSIDTALLKKIGQVLGYDFFQDLLEPETIKEIAIRNAATNKCYVELELSDSEIEKFGLKDKIVKKLKE